MRLFTGVFPAINGHFTFQGPIEPPQVAGTVLFYGVSGLNSNDPNDTAGGSDFSEPFACQQQTAAPALSLGLTAILVAGLAFAGWRSMRLGENTDH